MAKYRRGKKRSENKSNVDEDPGPDISLLSRPTATSVKGIRDVLKAFEEGTPEVHHLLSNECEIIYECRVCRSLFRSFLNFITHKRIYCKQQYTSGSPKISHFFNDVLDEDETLIVHNEKEPNRVTRQTNGDPIQTVAEAVATSNFTSSKPKAVPRKNLTQILGLLSQKASTNEGLKRIVNLDGFTAMNLANLANDPKSSFKGRVPRQHLLHLESMESTDVAIRQTVTLGPDGKILPPKSVDSEDDEKDSRGSKDHNELETNLFCKKCDVEFSSRKTLRHHMVNLHDPSRVYFVCPCCSSKFANSWSVHRHLKSIHNKSNDQLRKLRDQIQRVIRPLDTPSKNSPLKQTLSKKENSTEEQRKLSKKQSEMEIYEKDFRRCSGCTRKFDRLAAFNYHVRICPKRNAVIKGIPSTLSSSVRSSNATKNVVLKSNAELSDLVATPSTSALLPEEPIDKLELFITTNEKRLEQPTTTKKIEIQLRRDYNKISILPVASDTSDIISLSDDAFVRSRVNYKKILPGSLLMPKEEEVINNDYKVSISSDIGSSCTDDNSQLSRDVGILEAILSEHKRDEVIISKSEDEITNQDTSSQTLKRDNCDGLTVAEHKNSGNDKVSESTNISCVYNNSTDSDNILGGRNLKDVTISKILKTSEEREVPQSSILECILTDVKDDVDSTTGEAEKCEVSSLSVQKKQVRPIVKKRASVAEWNGFEDLQKNIIQETMPMMKKRFKANSFQMIAIDGSTNLETALQQKNIVQSKGDMGILINPQIVATHNIVKEIPKVLPSDEDDGIEESCNKNKADVDEDILKVIFLEEDLSQSSSLHHKKGTIIMGNGTFSLGSCVSYGERAGSEQVSNKFEYKTQAEPSSSSSHIKESELRTKEIQLIKMGVTPRKEVPPLYTIGSDIDHCCMDIDNGKEIRGRTSPTVKNTQIRASSAMETERRLSSDIETERRASSAMDRSASSSGSEQRLFLESTPSSSMEILPRSRPVRNCAKVKNSDFIYDLTDQQVKENGEILVVKRKGTKQQTQHQEPSSDTAAETLLNPKVLLTRTDKHHWTVEYSNPNNIKTVEKLSNNNSTGLLTASRKSVRVIAKHLVD